MNPLIERALDRLDRSGAKGNFHIDREALRKAAEANGKVGKAFVGTFKYQNRRGR